MPASATADRPIGFPVSSEELERLVPQWQEQAHTQRVYPEVQWLMARCMLQGYAIAEPDYHTRRVLFNPHNPKGSTRVDIPEMISRTRREVGRTLSMMREPTTKPIMTGAADIYRLNRYAKGAVAWMYHANNLPNLAPRLVTNNAIDGTCGLMPYWETFPEPRRDNETGEVRFRVIPIWQLYQFPADAPDEDHVEGIIWARPVSAEWVLSNFPDAKDEASMVHATPYDQIGTEATNARRRTEGYLVRQVFIKPSRRYPKGEHFWMVGNKIYKRSKEGLNFWLGEERVIPISFCRWMVNPASFHGISFGYQVCRLNKEINRQMSLLVRRAVMKAHPGYLMVPMGSCDTDTFKQQIGGVIPYRPSLINPESTRPFWLQYPPGTSDTDVVVNRLDTYMQATTSQHEATMGNAPGRADSAQAIGALVRQDQIPNEQTIASIDRCIARTFAIGYEIGRRRWSARKIATISGPAGAVRIQVSINPRELPTLDQIQVVTSLDLPMDKPALLNYVTQLASTPYKGATPLITQQEFRRFLMAMGLTIPGVDLIDPNEEAAWNENLRIYNDGVTPGPVDEPVAALENLQIHLEVHRAFAATMEAHAASPEVRAALAYHIQLTAQLMGGAEIPTNFDADLARSDSEQLTEEIELAQQGMRPELMAGMNMPGLLERIQQAARGGGGLQLSA